MKRTTRNQSKNNPLKSEFVQVVEKYLREAGWTNQELMNEIQIGETQLYRWARGDSVPRKAIVNRIAASLARQIDRTRQKLPHNPFPGSDEIDGIVNELLEAAGYRPEEEYVLLSELAKKFDMSQEYLSLLARRGKIDAYKQSRNWLARQYERCGLNLLEDLPAPTCCRLPVFIYHTVQKTPVQ
ncbi:MAG: hypothetical protein HC773_16690, partial [Scytonema sp. CRU_2_7]|nr:hypothetical protein [Scytonema sp. CRU_2_7]